MKIENPLFIDYSAAIAAMSVELNTPAGRLFLYKESRLVELTFDIEWSAYQKAIQNRQILWLTQEAIYAAPELLNKIGDIAPNLNNRVKVEISDDQFQSLNNRIVRVYAQHLKHLTVTETTDICFRATAVPQPLDIQKESSSMRISFSSHKNRLIQQQNQQQRQERVLESHRLKLLRELIRKLDRWQRKEFGADWLKWIGVLGTPRINAMRAILKQGDSINNIRPKA